MHFTEALTDRRRRPPTSRTSPRRTSGRWGSGRGASTARTSSSSPATRWRSGPSTPTPTRPGPAYSNGFDLLFRGVELVTGGQRLHRYADYLAALAARGEPVEPYAGYLDAFRHGMPPHGGFAIGLERFVARLTGAANVREVTAFPRDLHRLTP